VSTLWCSLLIGAKKATRSGALSKNGQAVIPDGGDSQEYNRPLLDRAQRGNYNERPKVNRKEKGYTARSNIGEF